MMQKANNLNFDIDIFHRYNFDIVKTQVMLEQTKKQNLRRFRIFHNEQFLQVAQSYTQIQPQLSSFKTQILIDKINGTVVFEKREKKFTFDVEPQKVMCSLILGVYHIKGSRFLIYAQSVYHHSIIQPSKQRIYQIAGIDYIPFQGETDKEEQAILISLKKVFGLNIKEVFSFGFYFSFERDMTIRSQILYSGEKSKSVQKFYWNKTMFDCLCQGKTAEQWKIPIIQGYYAKFQNFQGQVKLTYYIIARRSKYRSGTRFYSRGIDSEGNCSNMIQTQQIIVVGPALMSIVILSGSSPVFWQQKTQSKPIRLTRNKQLTKGPFVEHIKSLNSEYGNILLANIMEYKKEPEKLIIQAYEQIFTETQSETSDCCRYIFFDLNQALKQGSYQTIDDLFNKKLEQIIFTFGCFIYNIEKRQVKGKQDGIFRINCLDCLRRTDTFLQCLAMKILLIKMSILGMPSVEFSSVQLLKFNGGQELNSLVLSFKSLWAGKADYESMIYTGTRAASGRKDKLLDEIDNSFVALQRLYNQKFYDRMKQTAIDLLHPKRSLVKDQNKQSLSQLGISIITWNVNATHPQKLNIKKIVESFKDSDLIVFGIQQMIDLQPNNVMMEQQQTKMAMFWEKELSYRLAEQYGKGKYIFLQKIQMVGIMLILFINEEWKDALRSIHKDTVKTGYGGQFGNKGGVVIRVSLYDTSLCLTCAHLAAGQSKVKQRVQDFVQIHKKAFQQNKQGVQNQLQIQESSHKFFFGDLNFRIKGQFKEFADFIQVCKNHEDKNFTSQMNKYLSELYERDQLLALRIQSDAPYFLAAYQEEKINFLPTYKLQKSTGFYTTEKNRNPSWCDRILYWSDSLEEHTCQCVQYNSINLTGSDHRPVIGKFLVSILQQEAQRESILKFEDIIGTQFRDSYFDK